MSLQNIFVFKAFMSYMVHDVTVTALSKKGALIPHLPGRGPGVGVTLQHPPEDVHEVRGVACDAALGAGSLLIP